MLLDKILDLLFPHNARERIVHRLLSGEQTLQLCPRKEETTAGVKVTTLAEYGTKRMHALIHSLKYHNNKSAALVLAGVLYDYLAEELADKMAYGYSKIAIIPIPLSGKRKRERGYNQVERILMQLRHHDASLAKLVRTDILKRIRHTKSQTKLNRDKRLKNLEGAFFVQKLKLPRNTHVIVVDDIATTGATLREAKMALKNAGCDKVTLLAIARA